MRSWLLQLGLSEPKLWSWIYTHCLLGSTPVEKIYFKATPKYSADKCALSHYVCKESLLSNFYQPCSSYKGNLGELFQRESTKSVVDYCAVKLKILPWLWCIAGCLGSWKSCRHRQITWQGCCISKTRGFICCQDHRDWLSWNMFVPFPKLFANYGILTKTYG